MLVLSAMRDKQNKNGRKKHLVIFVEHNKIDSQLFNMLLFSTLSVHCPLPARVMRPALATAENVNQRWQSINKKWQQRISLVAILVHMLLYILFRIKS